MLMCAGIVILFALNLIVGSVKIPIAATVQFLFPFLSSDGAMSLQASHPSWHFIIMDSRLPQALTALLSGASLAVCGLLLQTAFRNPLAGPGIFGINSGAGLGVALVMLLMGERNNSSLFDEWFYGYSAVCIHWSHGNNSAALFLFINGQKQCDASYHRNYDRLSV